MCIRDSLLEGLLVAQDNIDEVIRIIRSSYDNAKENLMSRFGLDDVQAQAILDMQLKRLQGLDREKLQAEYKELEEKIAYFLRVLGDEAVSYTHLDVYKRQHYGSPFSCGSRAPWSAGASWADRYGTLHDTSILKNYPAATDRRSYSTAKKFFPPQ